MKKIYLLSCLLVLAVFFGGCGLTTFHPIFKTDGLLYDTRLYGSWTNEEGKNMIFQPASSLDDKAIPEKLRPFKNKFYVQQTSDSKNLAFLTKIGNHIYLDVYPAEQDYKNMAERFYSNHLVKMHQVYRIDFVNANSIKIRSIEQDYLEKLIKTKEVRMPYTVVKETSSDDEKIVITSSTEDLQRFIAKYGDDDEAYNNEKSLYTKASTVVYSPVK